MKRWIQANIIAVFLIATVMLSGTADAQVPCYDANLVTIPCPTTTTTTTPPTTTPPTTTTTPPTTTTTPPTTTRTRPVITDPPRTTTTTTTEAPRQIYTVRNGDTLVRIANRFDIDLNALVAENGIPDPTRIFVGQQLLIPPPAGEERGPLLTVPPPTRPDLPPLRPTITAQ